MLQQVVVKHASRLKELQLQRCHMDDVAAQAVAEGISRAGCLQELWIADNDVLPAFAVQLGESLAFPASLTVLDLSGNRIDPAHHRGLFRAFRRCAATLQEVYLARCCIAEDGLNAVLNAGVYASHALRVLSVSSGRLFRSAGRVLCGVLTECPNLERLYVQENFIEADGAVRMSVGIPYAKKLAVLGMGRCHIGGRGARAVAEAVMQSSSMCELDISGNSIQDADVQDICRHSNVSSLRLKFLDLSDNPLTERCWLALKALLEAHKDNPCIVVVRGTQLGAKSSYLEYNEPSPSC
ncbi:putative leucine-rich repeat protein (LRRP) [Trypanosoma grayi]|uniref:putative leucine-rich repeat protein (LRRP) n=1 Tax=Trypanosoma grayi TaxID=71804 RepID=UPI0004F468BB|nr:putative leucine-rich repeat protein (LRRP) [Trypanosoma grayi]KEG14338.1 putative leucine-rich repeat protein (LRRP) [Trypanosoma grayi]